MMSLQQIVFCSQIERILVEKKVCLSEYDSFLIKAYENLEHNLLVEDSQPITSKFVKTYKTNFAKAFRQFYIIYKKIVQQWELSAFDIHTINFNDIPSIKHILETFDTKFYLMTKSTITPCFV